MTLCGCFAGLALSAAEMLRPDDGTGKTLRIVFALVFAAVFISPFAGESLSLPQYSEAAGPYEVSPEYLEEAVKNDIEGYSGRNIADEVRRVLSEHSVPYDDIYADVNIDGDSCIDISRIYIASGRFEDAREAVREVFGNDIEVQRYETSEGNDK